MRRFRLFPGTASGPGFGTEGEEVGEEGRRALLGVRDAPNSPFLDTQSPLPLGDPLALSLVPVTPLRILLGPRPRRGELTNAGLLWKDEPRGGEGALKWIFK